MISEESCDTEDWSNDAENSALPSEINHILKCIRRKVVLNYNISQMYYCFYYFYQINADLLSIRDLKTFKNLTNPRLLNGSVIIL